METTVSITMIKRGNIKGTRMTQQTDQVVAAIVAVFRRAKEWGANLAPSKRAYELVLFICLGKLICENICI